MIRHAERQDLPAILSIYNDAIINTTAVYSYESQTIEEREEWFERKVIAGEPILVFEQHQQVVGFATYGSFRDWPAYLYSYRTFNLCRFSLSRPWYCFTIT